MQELQTSDHDRLAIRNRLILLLICGALITLAPGAHGDGIQDNIPENVRRIPKPGVEVPAARATALRAALSSLQEKLDQLRAMNEPSVTNLLPDLMIFERAVRCALDHDEFFDVKDPDKADALLVEGHLRADQLLAGKPEWPNQSGLVVRGYISRIDQTVQPYGLVVPQTYAVNQSVPTRCDIWFHGRGEVLSEVNFLWDRMKTPGQFTPEHTIVLHPYGRYCNAFKFAGEIDVLEALEDVQKRYRIDDDRISVRGFSMGGAACWQFATHYADRWFAANPGAGFSETPQFLKVFQQEELKPTKWEQTLWNLYDCDKWALNLMHCPTIAYSGEVDKQKQAADVMEEAMASQGMRLRHIIGAGMGHKYDADSMKLVESSLRELARQGRVNVPTTIRFSTMSLRYNRMHWLTVDGLAEHWNEARAKLTIMPELDHRGRLVMEVGTQNIVAFSVKIPAGSLKATERRWPGRGTEKLLLNLRPISTPASAPGPDAVLEVDGRFSDGSLQFSVHQDKQGNWQVGALPTGLRKRHGLQGPIDDAFMDTFVFVRPTGTPMNEAVGKWADAELTRAIEHWRRHFRGEARVVNDTDVTEELIQSANLVLWGDAQSNAVMAKIAQKLPIRWSAEEIVAGDSTFDSASHVPILIHPNPLNANRYVVINSSFTFRDYAYLNNARQVPMLPDWAVIDIRMPPGAVWPGKVAAADFFDEEWQLKK